ncbi:MAG: SDR family oxidoreductase [Spirochaetales bacterium]|nr:SDR family oxidoreductase [Spirochaetales bacterium]
MNDTNHYVQEMFGLSGTVAVITGGAGAIAGAFTTALLKAGAKVAIWDLEQSTIDKVTARLNGEIEGAKDRLFGYEADISTEKAVEKSIEATEKVFGAPNLLINGVGGNRGKCAFVDQDMETFEFVLKLNLVAGLMIPTKVFAAYWIERKIEGAIINMASMASYVPLSGVWAYDAAKAGVFNLTQAAAKEFAPHGIRVNAIAPGFFVGKQNRDLLYDAKTGELTDRGKDIISRTPYGRFGETEELAGALLFLASPKAAGFVTGISLAVDGGYLVDNI